MINSIRQIAFIVCHNVVVNDYDWQSKNIGGNVLNKKYNIVLFLLFIVYLFGYFSISKTLIPIMCVIQIFLLENIFKSQNKLIQIGKIIVIIASIILFIDSILN